ncbi:MAG: hypothetical protein P1U86_19685 [Verrucomicrobiales bacterium]|nr:hypothetical protein [Verrucomicrobiales bacterium]
MKDHEDVQRLIRLKKYETPGEEYFQNFSESFKERQRSEMLRRSSTEIFVERVQVWFEETHGAKWLVPAGAAAAIAAGMLINFPVDENASASSATIAGNDPTPFELNMMMQDPSNAEVIQLQLPKPQAIPGLSATSRSDVEGLVPTGAKLREL